MEDKKIKRRTGRARFNRQKRAVESLLEQEESLQEILEAFEKLELVYTDLQDRHDEYCETIQEVEQTTVQQRRRIYTRLSR